jgi:HSP20 family protein
MEIKDLIPWNRSRSRALARGQSEDVFLQLQRDVNRLFDSFWRGFGPPSFGGFEEAGGRLQPRTDIAETDKEVEVKIELPGIDEKDVDVALSEGVLTIKGEKKSEREEKGGDFYLTERSFGAFQRSIQLPSGVDIDKVSAEFAKGVLTVRMPKLPEAQSTVKKIEVKTH